LEPTINGLNIATSVEEIIISSDKIYYYEILNLKNAPDGEEDS